MDILRAEAADFSGGRDGGAAVCGRIAGAGDLTIGAGATLLSDGIQVNTLTINGSVTLRTGSAPSGTSRINTLFIASDTSGAFTGSLGLAKNKLIEQSADAADKSAKIAQLNLAVTSGANIGPNGPTWTGNGLTSSAATVDPQHYGVGVFDNAPLGLTTFGGLPVDTTSVLTSVAHLGDANDDGVVDLQDLSIITNHWQSNAEQLGHG